MESCSAVLNDVRPLVRARSGFVAYLHQVAVDEDLKLQVFAAEERRIYLVFLVEFGEVYFETQCELFGKVAVKALGALSGVAG